MNLKSYESTLRHLEQTLSAYTANESIAIAAEFGIRNEAALRRWLDFQENVVATSTGLETTAIRRRRRELAEVEEFHGDSFRGDAERPAVNWHEGGAGPALLLLNGWTASGLMWPEAWLRRLEERYRVIRVDNRGTGWSRTARYPFTIADLANDARNVLRACGVDHASVLGLSMGGMIAQELAVRHPEVVDKLVLVATRPSTPAQISSDGDAGLSVMKAPPPGADLHEFFVTMWGELAGEGFAADHPEVMSEVADQILTRVTPRAAVLNQARAMWSWHGASRLNRISAPTAVVHGNRDPLIPVGNGMRLARLIPDADYIELPGVGHLVPQEAGEALLEALES